VFARVNRAIRQALNQAEGEARLTVTQFHCLRAIAAKQGTAKTTHLARQLQVTAPSMTRTIDSLVERGLVLRQAEPADRRTISLILTEQGRELMDRYQSEIHERLRDLIAVLDPSQKQRLLAATGDLTVMLDAAERRERGGE
jgi:DNA-binding MarR family transcriptional regulator